MAVGPPTMTGAKVDTVYAPDGLEVIPVGDGTTVLSLIFNDFPVRVFVMMDGAAARTVGEALVAASSSIVQASHLPADPPAWEPGRGPRPR